jgi:sugar-specific transcriptional regulator TrmB
VTRLAAKETAQTKLTADATKSILNALRELGLTTYEAQAYLALIPNPDISATQLCNEAGIPNSKIYFALEELQKKGLVIASEGVPRHYRALHPKEALGKLKSLITQQYEGQIEKLDQLAVTLEPMYTRREREDIELAYVVKGFENVLSRMNEILKNAKREAIVFIPELTIYDRMESQLTNLKHRGVKVKLAVNTKIRKHVDATHFTEVREQTPTCEDCWLAIVDGNTVISSSQWRTDRCHAIMTQDHVLVAMSHEYFESPRCCV